MFFIGAPVNIKDDDNFVEAKWLRENTPTFRTNSGYCN